VVEGGRQDALVFEVVESGDALVHGAEVADHLAEDQPQRIDVHLLIVVLVGFLLGGEVGAGADLSGQLLWKVRQQPQHRLAPRLLQSGLQLLPTRIHLLCQPKVPNLHLLALYEDVGRLQVAVDEPVAVDVLHSTQHLLELEKHFTPVYLTVPVLQALLQCLP